MKRDGDFGAGKEVAVEQVERGEYGRHCAVECGGYGCWEVGSPVVAAESWPAGVHIGQYDVEIGSAHYFGVLCGEFGEDFVEAVFGGTAKPAGSDWLVGSEDVHVFGVAEGAFWVFMSGGFQHLAVEVTFGVEGEVAGWVEVNGFCGLFAGAESWACGVEGKDVVAEGVHFPVVVFVGFVCEDPNHYRGVVGEFSDPGSDIIEGVFVEGVPLVGCELWVAVIVEDGEFGEERRSVFVCDVEPACWWGERVCSEGV